MYVPQLKQLFDSNGDPLASGKLYFYIAGTSEPKGVYTTQARTSAITQPVTLDANGRLQSAVWLTVGEAYKVRCQDSDGVLQWELDDVYGSAPMVDTVLRRLSGIASPIDFGAAGDGSTDDATALQAAIDDSNTSVIDLEGKTFYCASNLTLASGITLRNGVLKFDGATANTPSLVATGTSASARAISTATAGTQTVTLADVSGISAGDVVGIRSADSAGTKLWWEMFRVEQVSGSDVLLDGVILGTYSTTPNLDPITPVQDVTLEDLTIVAEAGDEILDFRQCERITIRNCVFQGESSTNSDVRFHTCYDVIVDGCRFMQHTSTSAVDAIAISGATKHVTISDCRFERAKVGVDVGDSFAGSDLGVNASIHISGCFFQWCEQAVKLHDGGWFTAIDGNTILGDTTTGSASIECSAPQAVVTNNTIRNPGGDGIQCAIGQDAAFVIIDDNSIKGGTGPGDGIAIDGANTNTISLLSIRGNVIDSMSAGINIGSTAIDLLMVCANRLLTDQITLNSDAVIGIASQSKNYASSTVGGGSAANSGGLMIRRNVSDGATLQDDPQVRCVLENTFAAASAISTCLDVTNDSVMGNDGAVVVGGNLMHRAGTTTGEALKNVNGRNMVVFANAITGGDQEAIRHTGGVSETTDNFLCAGNVLAASETPFLIDAISGSDQVIRATVLNSNCIRNTSAGAGVWFNHSSETPQILWVTIVGNVIEAAGATGRDAIELDDSDNIPIVGNVIEGGDYGVNVNAATVTNDVVWGNVIQNHTSGAINGTPDVSADNDTA